MKIPFRRCKEDYVIANFWALRFYVAEKLFIRRLYDTEENWVLRKMRGRLWVVLAK